MALTDPHDDSRELTFREVTVTITLRSRDYAARTSTDPDTVLVFVDTPEIAGDFPIAVFLNDDKLYEGVIE